MHIGTHQLDNNLILAPMAGVTDRPFRQLCRQWGAGAVVSEMLTADSGLWHTQKSKLRMDHEGETGVRIVQIAGSDPDMMAIGAQFNQQRGADVIDINMGCPAKKVCKKAAGSALLRDPKLVKEILDAVVDSVDIPVTLKIRTGWCPDSRNGVQIAQIAEQSGIQALSVHGRTKQCKFVGEVEYDTIKEIKQSVSIPVIANGDIQTPQKAKFVLDYTGADAVMIGRAAQGKPWIFKQIHHYLQYGEIIDDPSPKEVAEIMAGHVKHLHQFYGEFMGVRIARKHFGWYLKDQHNGQAMKGAFNQLESPDLQLNMIKEYFQLVQKQQARAA
jgi:tRNA-dihydrouridine synthase B